MFIILKTFYFQLWVLYQSDLRISTASIIVGFAWQLRVSLRHFDKPSFALNDMLPNQELLTIKEI